MRSSISWASRNPVPKIRVLVVDDSVVVRRLLSDTINAEPSCEVVATAPNGKLALAKIPQVNPDIITLDVEMPEMDGLETLSEIRKIYPRLPVIMFSSLTERAAVATLRALELGATDYITKPNATSAVSATEQIREQLIPKIRSLMGARGFSLLPGRGSLPPTSAAAPHPGQRPGVRETVVQPRVTPATQRTSRIDLLAIGSSTGGPNALTTVISKLPATFPLPVVITQHMPPLFTRLLAERMNLASALSVHEAAGGEALEPGHVYLAPGDFHMEVRREGTAVRLRLTQAPPENSCRPSVDVMFRSVHEVYGGKVLAVILTGMGQDGLRGCDLIREAGGYVVAQDEATSVVWGMPGAVAKAGLADAVVPIDSISAEITRRVGSTGRLDAAATYAAKA